MEAGISIQLLTFRTSVPLSALRSPSQHSYHCPSPSHIPSCQIQQHTLLMNKSSPSTPYVCLPKHPRLFGHGITPLALAALLYVSYTLHPSDRPHNAHTPTLYTPKQFHSQDDPPHYNDRYVLIAIGRRRYLHPGRAPVQINKYHVQDYDYMDSMRGDDYIQDAL
jgi:hypothetical protein